MAQREPSMQEVLKSSFDYEMSNIYTSIPGIVISVADSNPPTVNVQPSLNMRDEYGLMVSERPSILNVPVVLPSSRQGGLTMPLAPGDCVLLVFSMRGLDAWKASNGYPSTPTDLRKFDIRDCFAIPGAFPFSESPNLPSKRSLNHDPSDVVLVHNIGTSAEVEIRLKTDGRVIVNSPTEVEINCESAIVNSITSEFNTDNFTVNSDNFSVNTNNYTVNATGTNVSTGTFIFDGSFVLNGVPVENHDHGGVQAGGSRTDPFGT